MEEYVSLAISDTMFPEGNFSKRIITADEAKQFLFENYVLSCCNPSHAATLDVLARKHGIALHMPNRAPKIELKCGDRILVLQANLPRLAEGEVHSNATVENATFNFSLWAIE